MQKYQIQGSTIFIESNGIIAKYEVRGNLVVKFIRNMEGTEYSEPFHTVGELPWNTEALLINELREKGEI